ncbi:putative acid sphingomyelinase [Xylariaceae sp. FL0662B]|nr:putative acid sphingomyelinase [Xylariaceae sp. FL0662B]
MRVHRSSVVAATLAVGQVIAAHFDAGSDAQKVLTPSVLEGSRNGLNLSTLAASIREDAQSPASCVACEATLLQFKLLASRGDAFFVGVVTELCKLSGIEDEDVCEGAIAREGPIVARGLRGIMPGSRTSRLACVALMGLCSYPEVKPHNVTFPSPRPPNERPGPSGRKPLHIVHYSDIHVDPLYVEGANANCSKPICCRDYVDLASNNDFPAGPNGEHRCDSPVSLEESMYAAIKDIVPDAAFSIFTGDLVDHAIWNTSEEKNILSIEGAYGRMSKAGMLVYGTAGNHEASPANLYPPAAVNNSTQWLYNRLSSSWSRWIGTRAADKTREYGAYSVKYPDGNLRIISISTNMYYIHNYWLYEEQMETDPNSQLAWLVSELDAAEKEGERVYIIGHMPMGASDAFHDGSNYFDQIIKRYSPTIAALFFGHTHLDEFELSYADYADRTSAGALVTSYIAPSLTPTSGHPAFRVYTVDPVTFAVLDATTYIANMSDPDFRSNTARPTWSKYYSAKEAYGPLVSPPLTAAGAELTPAFWHNVTEVLERNQTAFHEYWARKRRGWAVGTCEGECVRAEVCKMRAARAQDNCAVPGLILLELEEKRKFRAGGNNGTGHAYGGGRGDECGGLIIRNTLGSLFVDEDMLRLFEKMMVESHEDVGFR